LISLDSSNRFDICCCNMSRMLAARGDAESLRIVALSDLSRVIALTCSITLRLIYPFVSCSTAYVSGNTMIHGVTRRHGARAMASFSLGLCRQQRTTHVQHTYNIVQHTYNTRTTYVQHAHNCTQVRAGSKNLSLYKLKRKLALPPQLAQRASGSASHRK